MLSIQELRIGNWLEHKFSHKYVKVEGIWNDLIYCKEINPVGIHMSAYSPIELTIEILLNCGFIKETHMSAEENEYFIEIDEGDNLKFTLECGVLVPDPYYTGQPFHERAYPKYLHQLQNIYFVLTKEELEIDIKNNQSK